MKPLPAFTQKNTKYQMHENGLFLTKEKLRREQQIRYHCAIATIMAQPTYIRVLLPSSQQYIILIFRKIWFMSP